MGNEQSDQNKSSKSGIVVVAKPEDERKESTETELEYCPTFQPLLPSSLNIPESRPMLSELLKQIDNKSCLELCVRLQKHLQESADAVKFDQLALVLRIKEVDRISLAVMQKLVERQRAFGKFAEHSRKVDEISSSLSRLQRHLDKALNLADELNSLLPAEQQLEKLDFKQSWNIETTSRN